MNDHDVPGDGTNDASDVVDGPVGYAHLKDPATSGPIGADLDKLPPIDIPDDDPTTAGTSIDGGTDLTGLGRSADRG